MGEYKYVTMDVFTDARFGGNPLAVVLEASGLGDGEMQAIAREFNLSETTFVLPPADPAHDARVRIFTPAAELPFAGHPNVGTALVLAARRTTRPDRLVFEEQAGLVAITFDWSGTPQATLEAPIPLKRGVDLPAAAIAACVGLDAADLVSEVHAPCVAGVGTDFVIAQVRPEALARAAGDLAAMRTAAAQLPGLPIRFGVHLYVRNGDVLRTRMFAPLSGIAEDPATGSANAALAALLLACDGGRRLQLVIHQGVEMGRPSLLHAAARVASEGVRVQIGGGGVEVMQGSLRT